MRSTKKPARTAKATGSLQNVPWVPDRHGLPELIAEVEQLLRTGRVPSTEAILLGPLLRDRARNDERLAALRAWRLARAGARIRAASREARELHRALDANEKRRRKYEREDAKLLARARALELPSAPGVADNPRRYAVRLAKPKQKGPIDRITKALKRALEREKTAQK